MRALWDSPLFPVVKDLHNDSKADIEYSRTDVHKQHLRCTAVVLKLNGSSRNSSDPHSSILSGAIFEAPPSITLVAPY